ncbi:MAG: copper resistance protein CopB [Gammaproteobacteria bacterium RIFCSPHIGHO2_12_FULL_63_22]|nr:MAG: copper resistance protein CopB [Gammaproteobacteria bacterium RIFCSPHIGHO2_12_FULL_63_22]
MKTLISSRAVQRLCLLTSAAIALSVNAFPAFAQAMDHSKMQMPVTTPPAKKPVIKKPPAKKMPVKSPVAAPATPPMMPADPHAGHTMPAPEPAVEAVDHAAMGHDMPPTTDAVDHAAMGHAMPPDAPVDHAAMGHDMPVAPTDPLLPIPALSAADRVAAFPVVEAHAAHDDGIHSYWLLDRLEAWDADAGTGVGWEALSWVGTDLNRLWLRSEGERVGSDTESADIEVLYGRSVSRWWDVVAGVRHEFGEGPSQTFAAFGVIGLSPYKFEIDATAYIGQSGQTAVRLEAEYDTLLTNRLVLQWQAEVEFHGKDDALRGIGSGLSTFEAGLRLRYEFTRKFAPYIGVVRERAFGGTADFRRERFDDITDTRFVAGIRIWF